MPLQTGKVLKDRYRIVKLLGQGGFGAVYRAWDINMECPRAVKENLDTTPEAQKQFKAEAKILGELKHQNLPLVFDHFVIAGQGQYLVMEYVEGQDLQEMLNKLGGPLPEEIVLPWIVQICEALSYLHSQTPPIIHRDIKPANIRITPQGKAMLVDFGIAKVFDPILSTTVGARAITPGFSPHEQYGQGKTDSRTDIYALGATLYTLLTGRIPIESIHRVIKDPILPPKKVNPAISSRTANAIVQAMQPDPDQRPTSAKAFLADLKASPKDVPTQPLAQPAPTLASPSQARQGQIAVQPRPLAFSNLKKGLPLAIGLILVVFLVVTFWLNRMEPPPAKTAAEGMAAAGTLTSLAAVLRTPIPTSQPTATDTPLTPNTPLTPESSPLPTMPTEELLTPPPCIQAGQIWTSPVDGMVLSCIPAGTFLMGSAEGDPDADPDEFPQHRISLEAYWMDQTEITNAMYAAFLNDQGTQTVEDADWLNAWDESVLLPQNDGTWQPKSGYDNHPAIEVTWDGASAYCQWAGRRLPTEAEWEMAARGGSAQRRYPWGDEVPQCTPGAVNGAQFSTCDGRTAPVKTFSPNGFGLFDMAGNVWEWVSSTYAGYPYDAGDGRENPDSGGTHTLRGGAWSVEYQGLRVANRSQDFPEYTRGNDGFRCALSP